ncbi:MAG: radical SAM family heme chaperone HemW [Caldilineaceae bacterium]
MSQFTHAHGAEQTPIGLYIHIPFCARKCPYCDFNTYAGLGSLHERTVDALCRELTFWGRQLDDRSVTSIFLGGGTPTVLSHSMLQRLMNTVYAAFALSEHCEVTVEANPGTVDRGKFRTLGELGVNRLSIGVQSFQAQELRFLGRIHGTDDVYAAYEAARAAGFDNINLDFIFGLPNQKRADWDETLAQAVALEPDHLSLYSLIVEPDTPLFEWVDSGSVPEPDDDLAAELYETAMERLATGGYTQYEVSNWARTVDTQKTGRQTVPMLACRHNLLYWRNQEYVGIGPGAHSHLRERVGDGAIVSRRWSNVKPVLDYASRVETDLTAIENGEVVRGRASMGETMMLGLRLVNEGVSYQRFERMHGAPLKEIFATELRTLQNQRLIAMDADRVRLTRRGLMIGNQVFAAFLPDAADAMAA